jgi:hypothetical protein
VQIDAGGTVVLEGIVPDVDGGRATLGGLAGAGTLTHNPNWSFASFINVGNNNADTNFTGNVTGVVNLTKVGSGALTLGAQDNTDLRLVVASGRVRLTGDQRIESLGVLRNDPGVQALDLAGRSVRLLDGTMPLLAAEGSLNAARRGGGPADGVYDSTATPGTSVGIAFTPGNGLPLLMKLTRSGDANVDGRVDVTDLGLLATNFNDPSGALWDEGDFSGDGNVDVSDLGVLATNFNRTFAGAAALNPRGPATFADAMALPQFAGLAAAVPEPGGVALIAAGVGLVTRRRRAFGHRDRA